MNAFHEVRRILIIVLDDLHALEQREVSDSGSGGKLWGGGGGVEKELLVE